MKRRHARGLLALGGGIGLTIALFGAVAWACVPTARITLNPTSGNVGTDVTVTGSSFAADATAVKVWWGAAGGSRLELSSTSVAADRTIRVSFKVPDVAGGTHIVSVTQYRADGSTIGNPSNATFRVNAPGTTAPAPNLQGAVQDADGAAGLQAAESPAPAPATQTVAAPAPQTTTRAATAAPARTTQAATATAPATQTAPAAATETAAAPAVAAPVEAPAPAAPAVETPARTAEPTPATPAQGAAAEKPSRSDTPVGTLILLALLSLAFIGTGTAIFLNERKRVRARA